MITLSQPYERPNIPLTDMNNAVSREELLYTLVPNTTETGAPGDINREQTASGHSGFQGQAGINYELMGKKKKSKKPKEKTLQAGTLVEKSEKGKNS